MAARPFAVVAGGGTAGHVLPAIAVAQALVARGHAASSIRFVGSARGMEARAVPEAGFSVTLLPGRGVARRLSWQSATAVLGLLVAAARGFVLMVRIRPRVVVSVGGYASAPCALAAALLRIPLVVVEQNAVPGAANRLAARFARCSAVALPGTPLPRAVVTGNPVRPEIRAVDRSDHGRAAARAALGLPAGRVVVAAFGGSLGARRVNDAVVGLVRRWAGRGDLAVRHAVGRRDWPELSGSLPAGAEIVYQAVEYEDRMPTVFAAADVAVCRAGATSVAELAAVGLPSVLVPLPGAPGDHQTANARALASVGAAVLLPDAELTPARLADVLEPLVADPERRRAMGEAARTIARPDAADAVAALAEAAANRVRAWDQGLAHNSDENA